MNGRCTRFCDGCDYVSHDNGTHTRRICNYLLITGQRRGCPPGDLCRKKQARGIPIAGMAIAVAEDVRAAAVKNEARRSGRGLTSAAARREWEKRHADPERQIKQIRKWDALSDERLRKTICDMRRAKGMRNEPI